MFHRNIFNSEKLQTTVRVLVYNLLSFPSFGEPPLCISLSAGGAVIHNRPVMVHFMYQLDWAKGCRDRW